MKKVLMLAIVSVYFVIISSAFALEKTVTGFYWPLGTSNYSVGGSHLEHDSYNGGNYITGYYHLGIDMSADINDPVYPISEGKIIGVSIDGWTDATTINYAILIKHELNNGKSFIALYGHLLAKTGDAMPEVDDLVYPGKSIGTIGDWSGGTHLHFSIWPDKRSRPSGKYGRVWYVPTKKDPTAPWPKAYGQVDPISFLNTHHPSTAYREVKWTNMFGNDVAVYWTPANVSCDNAKEWKFKGDFTSNKGQICELAYLEFKTFADWTYILQDWYDTFFGNQQEVESAQTCRSN